MRYVLFKFLIASIYSQKWEKSCSLHRGKIWPQGFLQHSHFPSMGYEKVNQFPLVGKCFGINSQKITKMGTICSTNSQFGNMKFNQFSVLVFTEHWKFGNRYFNQFLPGEIPVRINSHFGNKLENQIPHLGTNIAINSY